MRFCAHPHCGVMVPKGYCPAHARADWGSAQPAIRIRGRKNQELKKLLYTQQKGRCAKCDKPVLIKDMVRDHIINLASGAQDQPTNEGCQGLCVPCHDTKTQQESLRGRQRNTR